MSVTCWNIVESGIKHHKPTNQPSPNPNVHSGFLKAEFSKVRKFQIISLYFVLGRDIRIAQFHFTDYTHKISCIFFYSKNKEDNVNSPVIALYIHANGGMPVLNNLSTPIIIKLPLLNVSISLIRLFLSLLFTTSLYIQWNLY